MIEKDLGMMVYYVKEDKKTKKGDILLKTIKAVKKFDKYKDRRFIFGIVTSVGRTFYIQCMIFIYMKSIMIFFDMHIILGVLDVANNNNITTTTSIIRSCLS